MDFKESTHRAHWLFTTGALEDMRRDLNQAAAARISAAARDVAAAASATDDHSDAIASGEPKPKRAKSSGGAVVSADEEALLLLFQAKQIHKICDFFKFPPKVAGTALVYFKRFYLAYTVMDHDPKNIMLTCIYLAGKIEEAYIGAEEFCKQLGQDASTVLRNEVLMLQALRFDLIVYTPYRSLQALRSLLEACRSEGPSSGIDGQLLSADPDLVGKCWGRGLSAVDALLLTDAPLVHPPGQLALAACRSGFRGGGLPVTKFIELVVRRGHQEWVSAAAVPDHHLSTSDHEIGSDHPAGPDQHTRSGEPHNDGNGSCSPHAAPRSAAAAGGGARHEDFEAALAEVWGALKRIDELGKAANSKVDQDTVAAIDRKLKQKPRRA